MIKVSVIVPIYNTGHYLRHCIESILIQSYTNLELILVDDGSTDSPELIISQFSDPRIISLKQVNGGVTAARKRGWQVSTGDYCLFVDADDMLSPNAIEFFVGKINEGGYDFIQGWYDLVDQNNKHQSVENKHFMGSWSVVQYIGNSLKAINDFQSIWIGIYRRDSIVEKVFDIDQSIYRGEDSLSLLGILNNCHKVLVTDKIFYHYFYRSDSVTRSKPLDNIYLYRYNKIRYQRLNAELRPLIEFHIMQRLVPLYLKFSGNEITKGKDVELIKCLIDKCADQPKPLRLKIQQMIVGRSFLEWIYRVTINILRKS